MDSQERQNYFGEGVAEHYDDRSAEMFDPAVIESTVDFLAGLVGDGAALELGIGTGRVALPLSRRGVTVYGVDQRLQPLYGRHPFGIAIFLRFRTFPGEVR